MSSPAWITGFLKQLAACGIVTRAAAAAGTTTSAVYGLRKTDGDFAAAWDDALEQSYDTVEAEARRRAVEGYEEPVVYQGQLTPLWERDETGQVVQDTVIRVDAQGNDVEHLVPRQQLDEHGRPAYLTVRKHSDALLQFLLKGYRKKFSTDRTELTGADGGPLEMSETDRTARIAQIMAEAKRRKLQADEFGDLA